MRRPDKGQAAPGFNSSTPIQLTNMSGIIAIAGGGSHSLALTSTGSVLAWGWNFWGQNDVPPSATNVVGIAAGGYHSVALRADGTVVSWGNYDTQAIVPPTATNQVFLKFSGVGGARLVFDNAPAVRNTPRLLNTLQSVHCTSRATWS